jgi:HSP20 family protein
MTAQELQAKEKQELQDREKTRSGRYYVPDVDIYEDENALWLWADMPGVDQEKVTVDLHEAVLTISGNVGLQEYEGLSPVYTEYNVGHFSRRFTLADGGQFDQGRISARMADGVLEIQLPKTVRAQPRRIEVHGG